MPRSECFLAQEAWLFCGGSYGLSGYSRSGESLQTLSIPHRGHVLGSGGRGREWVLALRLPWPLTLPSYEHTPLGMWSLNSIGNVILGIKIRVATRMLIGKLTLFMVLLCARRSATFRLSLFTSPIWEVGELTTPGFWWRKRFREAQGCSPAPPWWTAADLESPSPDPCPLPRSGVCSVLRSPHAQPWCCFEGWPLLQNWGAPRWPWKLPRGPHLLHGWVEWKEKQESSAGSLAWRASRPGPITRLEWQRVTACGSSVSNGTETRTHALSPQRLV